MNNRLILINIVWGYFLPVICIYIIFIDKVQLLIIDIGNKTASTVILHTVTLSEKYSMWIRLRNKIKIVSLLCSTICTK